MDAITYFLSHLLIQNIALATISLLLGLWLGRITWGRFREKFARSEARLTDTQSALERLQHQEESQKQTLKEFKKENSKLKKRLKNLKADLAEQKKSQLPKVKPVEKNSLIQSKDEEDWGFLPPQESKNVDKLTDINGGMAKTSSSTQTPTSKAETHLV